MNNGTTKYCVFCGAKPDLKNKEHILPQWLIELTGDPKRVVPFGRNLVTNKIIKFDWSSFVFPSCHACNDRFSNLESEVKPIILALLKRESILSSHVILLLDWLDKVRTGLWLGYSYLQNNSLGIRHKFYIDKRIGMKDRMVAVYPIESEAKGLNSFGVETIGFQLKPSCISLRINNLHILNMSWDFMCSARCGFPFPQKYTYNLDKNISFNDDKIDIYNKFKHPIMREKIIKASILIYQPILIDVLPDEIKKHPYLKNKLLLNSAKYGALFRQYNDHIDILNNFEDTVDFDDITEKESDLSKNIIKQTYELQLKSLLCDDFLKTFNKRKMGQPSLLKVVKDDLTKYINYFTNL
jgi:hypothetical protein